MIVLVGLVCLAVGGLVGSFLFPNGKFRNPQKG